jgi:hypothetical protein
LSFAHQVERFNGKWRALHYGLLGLLRAISDSPGLSNPL